MASAKSELSSASSLGNSWTGRKVVNVAEETGYHDAVSGSAYEPAVRDYVKAVFTNPISHTAEKVVDAVSDAFTPNTPGYDPNGVDWIGYSEGGPSWHNPFGSSASAQNPETVQPYAFMDTSLASMFGMDPATHYQEALSNTAYQRQVRDLQAAGLNPVLGISGNGAAVFPGSFGGFSSGGSGGSSYGSVGSGKSTSSLSEKAHTLSYWLPTFTNGVVNLAVSLSPASKKNKFAGYAAGHIAQNIVSGALGAIRNHF